jgi:hypothetical protein
MVEKWKCEKCGVINSSNSTKCQLCGTHPHEFQDEVQRLQDTNVKAFQEKINDMQQLLEGSAINRIDNNFVWEYCQLILDGSKYVEMASPIGGVWSYGCEITFITPTDSVCYPLTTLEMVIPFNPFHKMMAILGLHGWELISIQHGNVETTEGSIRRTGDIAPVYVDGHFVSNRAVAYFKRSYSRLKNENK